MANPSAGDERSDRRQTALLALLLAASPAVCAEASARLLEPSSRGLAARDPGSRVGGDTIVGTGDGAKVFGVPRRPNFIIALGSNETITGGDKNDQLGARGTNVTIRGGRGSDIIYGGPGGTLVGGPGHDQMIDTKANATIMVRGSGEEAVASGPHDRVLCSPTARTILIYRGATDTISRACRADHARVLSVKSLHAPSLAELTAATKIEGNGSSAFPYQAPCDEFQKGSCTVSSFLARTGWPLGERVRARLPVPRQLSVSVL